MLYTSNFFNQPDPDSQFFQLCPSYPILFSEEVLTTVRDTLHPLAEDWSGVSLEHTATYGVRYGNKEYTTLYYLLVLL